MLNNLEKKFGKYAIKNLMYYILVANGLVFILQLFGNQTIVQSLTLDFGQVMKGQVWRLLTFVMIPPVFGRGVFSILLAFFVFRFYYWMGQSLEQAMGVFRFNLFYFTAMLWVIISAAVFSMPLSGYYINMSLFFVFAYYYPDVTILFMFFLPLKMKYIAYISGFFLIASLVVLPTTGKIAVVVAMGNFVLFFGSKLIDASKRVQRRTSHKKKITPKDTIHQCEVCQRTESNHPELEFRYCSQCDGYHEYCLEHLHSHQHVEE